VTEEQSSRQPIFIAPPRAARLLTGCFVADGQRPQRVFSLFASRIQPKIRSSATIPVADLVHLICAITEIDQEKTSKFYLTEIHVRSANFRAKRRAHIGTQPIIAMHIELSIGTRGSKIGFALLNAS
jgi:hypothetical protein